MNKKQSGRPSFKDRNLVRLNRVEFLVNEYELEILKERSDTLKVSMGKSIRMKLNLNK